MQGIFCQPHANLSFHFILVPYNPLCYLHSCPSQPFIFLLKVRLSISIVSELLMYCVTAVRGADGIGPHLNRLINFTTNEQQNPSELRLSQVSSFQSDNHIYTKITATSRFKVAPMSLELNLKLSKIKIVLSSRAA